MNSPLIATIAGLILAGFLFVYLVPLLWKRRNIFGSLICLLVSVVMALTVVLFLCISTGIKGYTALTREDRAATVYITPLGSQQFRAKVVRPNLPDTVFSVAGDELYIDARVLKWKPIVNILGIHTAYCLDRVSGRYRDAQDETSKVRTVYSLTGPVKPWDLFFLRTRFEFLSPLVDAYYGSAAFVPVNNVRVVAVTVSASGLIARPQ
jgi:hypothetical protein